MPLYSLLTADGRIDRGAVKSLVRSRLSIHGRALSRRRIRLAFEIAQEEARIEQRQFGMSPEEAEVDDLRRQLAHSEFITSDRERREQRARIEAKLASASRPSSNLHPIMREAIAPFMPGV